MQSFGDLCLDAYFSEDASLYDRVSVNAGLYSLFWDYASTTQMSPEEKERNLAYARLCRDNLETGLADMPMVTPLTTDAVQPVRIARTTHNHDLSTMTTITEAAILATVTTIEIEGTIPGLATILDDTDESIHSFLTRRKPKDFLTFVLDPILRNAPYHLLDIPLF